MSLTISGSSCSSSSSLTSNPSRTTELADDQEMLEFSGSCQLPCGALSPFLELGDIDNLCRVSKHFKGHLLEVGRQLAYTLHKLALRSILSMQKIGDNITATSTLTDEELETGTQNFHQGAVIVSFPAPYEELRKANALKEDDPTQFTQVMQDTYDYIVKQQVFPLPLYRRLTANISQDLYGFFLTRFKMSSVWKGPQRQMLYAIYSQLRQAKIYMPMTWALTVRLFAEDATERRERRSETIANICGECLGEWEQTKGKQDVSLECAIGIAEQIPSPKLKGVYQSMIADSCAKGGKPEIAKQLLGRIKACDSSDIFGEAVCSLIKHEVSSASKEQVKETVTTVIGYLKQDFLESDELLFYFKFIVKHLLSANYVKEAVFTTKSIPVSPEKRAAQKDEAIKACLKPLVQSKEWVEAFKLASELSGEFSVEYAHKDLLEAFINTAEDKDYSLFSQILSLVKYLDAQGQEIEANSFGYHAYNLLAKKETPLVVKFLDTLLEPAGSDLGYKVYLNQHNPSQKLKDWVEQRREKAKQPQTGAPSATTISTPSPKIPTNPPEPPRIPMNTIPDTPSIPASPSTTAPSHSTSPTTSSQSTVKTPKKTLEQSGSQTSLVASYWKDSIVFRIFSILSLGLLPLCVYLWEACCGNRQ